MRRKAEQLVGEGVPDPRMLPGAVAYSLEAVSTEEGRALAREGERPEDYQVLRISPQGLQLIAGPTPEIDGLQLRALFPKILKQQRSLIVLTPEQEAQGFQDALGPAAIVEIRLVFQRTALYEEKEDE